MLKKVLFMTLAMAAAAVSTLLYPSTSQAADKNIVWQKTADWHLSDLFDVAFNDKGAFAAVGSDGTILISEDGRQWSVRDTHIPVTLNTVTYGGSGFVAAGEKGTVLVSRDGNVWTPAREISFSIVRKDLFSQNTIHSYNQYYYIPWEQGFAQEELSFTDMLWDGHRYVAVAELSFPLNSDSQYPTKRAVVAWSQDGMSWTVDKLTYGTGDALKASFAAKSIIFTGEQYVIAADEVILVSRDLQNWEIREQEINGSLNDIAYNGTTYAAVGWDGRITEKQRTTGIVYVSRDSRRWNEVITDNDFHVTDREWAKQNLDYNGFAFIAINTIVWDGKRFVAGCNFGMFLESPDGQDWSLLTGPHAVSYNPWFYVKYAGEKSNINKIVYDGNKYVAVGNFGTILVSEDAADWEVVTDAAAADFSHIVWDGRRYVAAGRGNLLAESADGRSWTKATLESLGQSSNFTGMAAGNGVLFASGYDSNTFRQFLYISDQPGSWTKLDDANFPQPVTRVRFAGGRFEALGKVETAWSRDGVHWTKESSGLSQIRAILEEGPVRLGVNYEDQLYASTDGKRWTAIKVQGTYGEEHFAISKVMWNGQQYMAVAKSGRIYVSRNGESWREAQHDGRINALAWNGAMFAAVGNSGLMLTSTDGLHWQKSRQATNQNLNDVVWDGEKFLAVGDAGMILAGETLYVIRVNVNGQYLVLPTAPVTRQNTAMLPARELFTAIGAQWGWNAEDNRISVQKGEMSLTLKLNERHAAVNGQQILLPVPAQTIQGKTMVPARFVVESLGGTIRWDGEKRTFFIEIK